MNSILLTIALTLVTWCVSAETYRIVGTGQTKCYDNRNEIAPPKSGQPFYGQDAQFQGTKPAYKDNGNGTVTDLNTGLMWQKTPPKERFSWADAAQYASTNRLAGFSDWRLPSIKESFSLAQYYSTFRPSVYLDTKFFDYWKPVDSGLGPEMGQYWVATAYAGLGGPPGMPKRQGHWMFNFSDGHLKAKTKGPNWVRLVRGNSCGENKFVDNHNGTISDLATGLMWQKADDGVGRTWSNALAYAHNLRLAGYTDWRVPNLKELQSIVDYTRAPDASATNRQTAAIDPIFSCTLNPNKLAYFWTSTTTCEGPRNAYYISFGEALSVMGNNTHGAGAIRSDPKAGNPADWSRGLGPPPADVVVITNYVRCVRKVML